MQLLWGVQPVLSKEYTSTDEMIDAAMEKVKEEKLVEAGDIVVLTAGGPINNDGVTNTMKVLTVK